MTYIKQVLTRYEQAYRKSVMIHRFLVIQRLDLREVEVTTTYFSIRFCHACRCVERSLHL